MSLRYQWYKDGVAIEGATSATYSKSSAIVDDAGSYYCRVTNAFGSVNSNAATVTVAANTVDANTLLLVQVDAGGNIVERTGNGTITTSGTVIVDTATTHDGYGSIKNTSGYTTIAYSLDQPSTSDFTLEGWFYTLSDSTEESEMHWLTVNPYNGSFCVEDLTNAGGSRLRCSILNNSGYDGISESNFRPYMTWTHIAYVRHNEGWMVFINGERKTISDPPSYLGITMTGLQIGALNAPCCWENIRISNIARYTSNFTPPSRF